MCDTDVAMSFLMLASVITRVEWGEEEVCKTILSSSRAQLLNFVFSFLLTKLKETQSEKLSIIQFPGENWMLVGENDGKIPRNLLYESVR